MLVTVLIFYPNLITKIINCSVSLVISKMYNRCITKKNLDIHINDAILELANQMKLVENQMT